MGDVVPLSGAAASALTDDNFSHWWLSSVSPEDRAEYIHLHHGDLHGARMICALDYFTAVLKNKSTDDTIVKAYCVAHNLPLEDAKLTRVRYAAQALYEDEAVQMLAECVRYRAAREAHARIEKKYVQRVEKIYSRLEQADEEGYVDEDYRGDEKLVLTESAKFMALRTKADEAVASRRAQRSVTQAMQTHAARKDDPNAVPSLEEAKAFLSMLAAKHGTEAINDLLAASMLPAAPVTPQETQPE